MTKSASSGGVTNDKNKKQLESQSGQLAELQKNLGSMKNTVTELKKSMAVTEKSSGDANRSVAEIKTTIAQIGQNLSDMRTGIVNLQQRISQGDPVAREASQQAALVQEQAERLQSRLDSLEVQLGRHEDSLKGIDTFRRSVNSDLNKLKGTSGGYTSPPY
jgi:chromosome segregation ATPase